MRNFKISKATRYVVGYYGILIGFFLAVATLAMTLGTGDIPARNQPADTEFLAMTSGFWQAFILSVILAPIVEEIVFRGVLFTSIKHRYGLIAGVIASAVIFTMVHISPIQMISVLPMGIYLAIMYHKIGSIYPGILLHASWNCIVLIIAQSAIN